MTDAPAHSLMDKIATHVEALAGLLAKGESAELLAFLRFTASFTRYSANNQMLIWLQAPEARFVAGFHDWKRKGRHVKRGAKALKVIAPVIKQTEGEGGHISRALVGFKVACVFADYDTEGEPLPDDNFMVVREGGSRQLLDTLVRRCPVPVVWAGCGTAHGKTNGHTILLDPTRCAKHPGHAIRVLFHEWAHVVLHFEDGKTVSDHSTRELEADAAAYVLCTLHGLDAAAGVSQYVLSWGGDPEALRASLGAVAHAVGAIAGALTPGVAPRARAA